MSQTVINHRTAASVSATALLFAAVFAGALALTLGLRAPSFIHHDTSEIVMWGHSGWAAGFWKHPPFLPWVSRLWFSILPMSALSLAALTALNMTVSAWAVWRIALLTNDPTDETSTARSNRLENHQIGLTAVVLLVFLPFASVMAIKLNHNAVLISLWPLTVLAFLRALDQPTILRGAIFGVVAALAVLAKYYSLLLLASCIAASFAVPARAWKFYRRPAPYAAVAAFLAAMTPHGLWMLDRSASPLGYAFNAGAANPVTATRGPAMALSFAVQTPLLLTPVLLIAWLLWRVRTNPPARPEAHRHERALIILTVVPYLLTVVLVLFFNLRGAVAWAMPLFVCVPAIIAARIGPIPDRWLHLMPRVALAMIIAIVIAGQIGVRIAIQRGADGVSEPRREIAEAITTIWHASETSKLPIVAGDNRLTSATVIFSRDHPQGWPSFSPLQAPWIIPQAAEKSGFVAVCRPADQACIDLGLKAANGRATRCTLKHRVQHLGATGPWFEAAIFIVPPETSTKPPVCPPE